MEKETVFLTEQMVSDQVTDLLNEKGMDETQKEAQLYVLEHILDLLRQGQLLTINASKEIKLYNLGGLQ